MKNTKYILFFVFPFLAYFRYVLENTPIKITGIAIINLVGLFVVLFHISSLIEQGVKKKISAICSSKSIAERENKKTSFIIPFATIVIAVLVVYKYYNVGFTELGNDIIAILSLGLSILDNDVASFFIMIYPI